MLIRQEDRLPNLGAQSVSVRLPVVRLPPWCSGVHAGGNRLTGSSSSSIPREPGQFPVELLRRKRKVSLDEKATHRELSKAPLAPQPAVKFTFQRAEIQR